MFELIPGRSTRRKWLEWSSVHPELGTISSTTAAAAAAAEVVLVPSRLVIPAASLAIDNELSSNRYMNLAPNSKYVCVAKL